MSKRAAKFVSAIFASLLGGIPLATISHSAPDAADSCLSGPKGALPEGGHWYYRIDRATKRHCWYIRDEKEKLSRAAPEGPPSDDSVFPPVSPPNASTQRSIANARAELPMPQMRVEQDTSVFAGQQATATAADAPRPGNSQRSNAGDVDAQRSVFASRWPELADVNSSAAPAPSPANSQVNAQLNSEAAPPPASAAVTLAAADATSAKPSGSIQQLLIVIVGALSLAGLIASAIVRFGGARRTRRRDARVNRRVNWDSVRTNRPSLADEARAAASMQETAPLPEGRLARDLRAADDPNERIEQMLARLARSAAS